MNRKLPKREQVKAQTSASEIAKISREQIKKGRGEPLKLNYLKTKLYGRVYDLSFNCNISDKKRQLIERYGSNIVFE